MSESSLYDQAHRDQALNTSQSFIVQAPAGSGKTELLTLRYLKLLSICSKPEEVLAITFTRKAAGEMRERIIEAIRWADSLQNQSNPVFADELQRKRFEIADQVVKHDRKHDWRILQNPSRLRIQTIDSFCLYLSNQLPIQSSLGGSLNISTEVESCFIDAVRSTLAKLDREDELGDAISQLLQQLDNDVAKVERLLVRLLYQRDQWLPYILQIKDASESAKTYLQHSLTEIIEESLLEATEKLLEYESEILELANFSASNLGDANSPRVLNALPGADYSEIQSWRRITGMLTTQSGGWRLRVDKRNGFPADDKSNPSFSAICKQKKQLYLQLREQLQESDDLLDILSYLERLPNPDLEQSQWQFLSSLTEVLSFLNRQLLLSFRKFRIIDHTQTGASASMALGSENSPTDLALSLDHRIQHILVDEFQDTSKLQLDLLQKLTEGWQADEGQTLFVVGDAMQSCYSFRNANVGIYLRAREHGIGQIYLHPLTLQTNFRSQGNIVNWVNQVFRSAFPEQANSSRGAVPYTESVAEKEKLSDQGVTTELILHEPTQRIVARQYEAQRVVEKILQIRKQDKDGRCSSIGILIRNRPHLNELIPALRAAGIQWQATDIDRLDSLPLIEDLLSLLRAILNLADRVAWLAILRAPWMGLKLADLHAIESSATDKSIWSAVQNFAEIESLSLDAYERLQAFVQIMKFILGMRYRTRLRQLVEACWCLLRGPLIVRKEEELACVAHFLNLLAEHESGNGIKHLHEFQEKVYQAFVPTRATAGDDSSQNRIHILTMHKAKGLEFDHVIIPGLANKARSDDKDLIQWHERLNQQGDSRLFIAALSKSGKDDDPLYSLIRHERQHKTLLENTRLLYIAITRARKTVSLLATIAVNSKGDAKPAENSLLSRIWRELQTLDNDSCNRVDLSEALSSNPLNAVDNVRLAELTRLTATPITRLQHAIKLNPIEDSLLSAQLDALNVGAEDSDAQQQQADVSAAAAASGLDGSVNSLIGTLIHEALETYVTSQQADSQRPEIKKLEAYWRLRLSKSVDSNSELDTAVATIRDSVLRSIEDEIDSWIFDHSLRESRCELAISQKSAFGSNKFIVDRSFIDKHDTRWVIDYKTARPAAAQSIQDFIRLQSELHTAQLQNYKSLFEAMESRPVKIALFFTSIPRLVELN